MLAVGVVSFPVCNKNFPVPIAGNSTGNPSRMLSVSVCERINFGGIPCIFLVIREFDKTETGSYGPARSKCWAYRERKRRESAAARALIPPPGCPVEPAPLPAECLIKGNVSSNGRIYHMPGSRDYHKVVINSAKGERYFGSEEQARACGWREPGPSH
jgi:hypothetical protein